MDKEFQVGDKVVVVERESLSLIAGRSNSMIVLHHKLLGKTGLIVDIKKDADSIVKWNRNVVEFDGGLRVLVGSAELKLI